jgi:TRAP-type C4-dicarboxylate transport system permease small subunit
MERARKTTWGHWLARVLEVLVIVAVGALVLDVLLGVGTRGLGTLRAWLESRTGRSIVFLPKGQVQWTEELARFLMVWSALLGAALAFQRRAHLGVDYFVGKLHPAARKWTQTLAHLVVMAFAGLVLIEGGLELVGKAMASEQVTPALGLKKWIVYAVVPVSGVFMILFSLENMLTDLIMNDEEVVS